MYGKLYKGILQYAPKNYTTDNGGLIINFNNNIEIMKEYGYKEIINIKPSYDSLTQYIEVSNYEETEENITVVYVIKEKEIQETTPTLDERVSIIEEELNMMAIILDEEANK